MARYAVCQAMGQVRPTKWSNCPCVEGEGKTATSSISPCKGMLNFGFHLYFNLLSTALIQIDLDGHLVFAKVLYYFHVPMKGIHEDAVFAMVSVHRPPNMDLLKEFLYTLWSCQPGDETTLCVIPVQAIKSVVAVIPHPTMVDRDLQQRFEGRVYVIEKMGLDLATMAGIEDDAMEDNEE